ncbi:MAG: T9SS type A sorting domain-containing protein [Chitinophagales bacterium]|nr:T9SS type A sorting domain-containing protein [Chitinophagales bacterium]
MKTTTLVFLLPFLIVSQIFFGKSQSNFAGSGIALQFNGMPGNFVNLGDVYNDLNFPITFETWFNLQGYPLTNSATLFSCDNDSITYRGFWVYYLPQGTLRFEFGNGQGAGSQFRRGVETVQPIPFDRWTHIAVVCKSATDIHIYFNGIDQAVAPTDGSSEAKNLVHSSAPSNIGRVIGPSGEGNSNGFLDEIKLWNVARSETNIRKYMCRKVDSSFVSLIGYWKADESYTSQTVLDYSMLAENGSIGGSVPRVTSGAPIGDDSKFAYTNDFKGKDLAISSASGDQLMVGRIKNNPYGLHIYRVDSIPYYASGLNQTPFYYYGVFCAEGSDQAKYSVSYKYSLANGIINSQNEDLTQLMTREDGSVKQWTNTNGNLDTSQNRIRGSNQDSRGEYILNINSDFRITNSTVSSEGITIYPNPAQQFISISLPMNESPLIIRIFKNTGSEVKTISSRNALQTVLDISSFYPGIYIAEISAASGNYFTKFEIIK